MRAPASPTFSVIVPDTAMPPPLRTVAADYHFYAYDYAASAAWALSPAQPARAGLRFYSLSQDLTALQAWGAATQHVPNIALQNINIPAPDGGLARNTQVLSFGGPVGAGAANCPAVVFTGGIHAREWVAPAMTYLLAEYLVRNYSTAPATPHQVALANLVNTRRIVIVPMLNPHGNNYTVFSPDQDARMWRKNRRRLPMNAMGWAALLAAPNPPLQNINVPAPTGGNLARYDVPVYRSNQTETVVIPPIVIDPEAGAEPIVGVDLNRNCSTAGWGHHCPPNASSGKPAEDDYFGPRVASETETQNIQAVLTAVANAAGGLASSIDYHSYSQAILYPSEASYAGNVGPNYTGLGQVLQKLIGPATEPWWSYDYSLGTPLQIVEYDAVGSLGDRAALTHNARAFVVELDPASANPGFQLPENQIQTVFEKNIRGALALIASAGQASTVSNTRNWVGYGHRAITSGESQFLNWNVFGRGNQLP